MRGDLGGMPGLDIVATDGVEGLSEVMTRKFWMLMKNPSEQTLSSATIVMGENCLVKLG